MSWMLTASGVPFDLRLVHADAVRIEDIAHHLAQINRYCGAAMRPISVAEHSLLVLWLLRQQMRVIDPSLLLAGLLHDAHEAYFGDHTSPVKRLIGAPLTDEERRIQQAVLRKLQVWTAFTAGWSVIHWADMTALATERRDLMPAAGPQWEALADFEASPLMRLDVNQERSWRLWRDDFLGAYHDLCALRTARHTRAPELTEQPA